MNMISTTAPRDPNFTGAGRADHRRGRPLSLHHHQAGRLSLVRTVAQRLAAGAHPFFAVRAGLRPRASSRRCISRRSAVPARRHRQCSVPEAAREAHRLPLRSGNHRAVSGRCPIASTSCCAAATRRRWSTRAWPARRPGRPPDRSSISACRGRARADLTGDSELGSAPRSHRARA